MRQVLIATVTLALASNAHAQDAPVPIEQMNCEQLYAEYAAAGSPRLDPALTAKVMARQQNATTGGQIAGMIAEQAAMTAICMVPGVQMVCGPLQELQGARQEAQTRRIENETNALLAEVQQATAGIDMNKMAAITIRSEELKCPPPPAGPVPVQTEAAP